MATALQIVRNALHELGLGREGSNKAARELIDNITYDATLKFCLEQGFWNFAMREATLTSAGTPSFGYTYYFTKPADWIRTASLSTAAGFIPPLDDFQDQIARILANTTPLYIRYVSNDTAYGLLLSGWSESFTRYVELELASRVVTQTELPETQRAILAENLKQARANALARDAQNSSSMWTIM